MSLYEVAAVGGEYGTVGRTMRRSMKRGIRKMSEQQGKRFSFTKDADVPVAEIQALSRALASRFNVLTMVVVTTPNGHALLTTKNVEEGLVRYPLVGRALVDNLRAY